MPSNCIDLVRDNGKTQPNFDELEHARGLEITR